MPPGPNLFPDSANAFTWVLRPAAVGIFLVTVEMLVRRDALRDEALMSWPVGSLRRGYLVHGPLGGPLDAALRYPNVCFLLALRAAVAAAIAFGPQRLATSPGMLCSMTVLLLLIVVRHPYGQDGADQMALIVFAGASLTVLAGGGMVMVVYLWFIALQVCLSYATAGIAKSTAAGWRDGTYLAGVIATGMYGHPGLARILSRRPRLARSLSLLLVTWESLFPIVLAAPRPAAYAILASGLFFHLLNGIFMGLNDFLWLFAATYPALLYCIQSRGW